MRTWPSFPFFRLALLFLLIAFTAKAVPPGYHLVWGDEFSGAAIDSSKWSWGSLPWGGNYHNNQYASYITAADSYLNGSGQLVLRCRSSGTTINGTWIPWTEGFVHSNGKFRYTYGYAEVRARFPVNQGTWPAFWSLSDGWPPEFDIAEYFGDDDRMHMGLYHGSWDSSNFYGQDFGNWHTYGLEWGPGYAKWYRDGSVWKTINQSYVPNQSMYLILNSGMTSGFDGTTPNPNYTEFDYCRVYLAGGSTPPTISDISSRTTPTNTPTPPLPFTIDDSETPLSQLTLTASSDNTTLVPNTNIVIGGSGANRTVTVLPAPNQGGTALITLSLFDGQFTVNETFNVSVSGTNSSPTLSALGDIRVPMNGASGRAFTVDDNETDATALVVTVTSSNPDLIPVANIWVNGSGSNRMVTVKPVPGFTGSSIVDVIVSDGALSAHDTFRATVFDPNNLVTNPGFEDGLIGWTNVFGGTVGSSASTVHDGLVAGTLTGRGDWYHGLGTSLLGKVGSGQTYHASAWVRLGGSISNDNAYITVRILDASGMHYYSVVNGRASSSGWTRLAGDFTPVIVGTVTNIQIYLEGPAAGRDLIVDDVSVVLLDANVIVPLGAIWRYRDNGVFPGVNWLTNNYNDVAWASGPAQLGYGDGDEATIVGYGPSSANKFITTWFRHWFNVPDPFAWTNLVLKLIRDDGAIVYLNGVEIFRNNMTNPVAATSFASGTVTGAAEAQVLVTNLNSALLRAGSNLFAVEIHQDATNSSDISFDLELSGDKPAPEALIGSSAVWKYNDSGVNLGTSWRAVSYNDGAWPTGFGQLGYGDGDENTVVGYGPAASSKYITTYFRHALVPGATSAFSSYVLRLKRDDGAVVYLNGTEIFRSNIGTGSVTYSTLANAASDDGETWFATNVPPAVFMSGTNVMAVEVHQNAANSTDLSFDLELLAYGPASLPALVPTINGSTVMMQWPSWAGSYSLYSATNMMTPVTWTLVTNAASVSNGVRSIPIPLGNGFRFFRLSSP